MKDSKLTDSKGKEWKKAVQTFINGKHMKVHLGKKKNSARE